MVDHGVTLKGITWNHSRGYVSVVATAQRFSELNPGIEIQWEKRSLQAFADAPIEGLAERYDLLIIDHPWAGLAARKPVLLPLQKHLPAEFLSDQAANSVGKSHESYGFDGNQCALALDAATPVASYRPDLLAEFGSPVPETWNDLLALARQGRVAFPGIPIDSLMNFYMLCSSYGADPIVDDEWAITVEMGTQALEQLRELASLCNPEIFDWNPIAVYEAMSRRNDLAYCPFAYGYSNYSREGYADHVLVFDDLVKIGDQGRGRTTLGGTGLAISAKSQHIDVAVQYALYTARPATQRTVFFECGGQPGHRTAWTDHTTNQRTQQFFANTLPALDRAYLRPRYPGYLDFQDNAGDHVRDFMMNSGNPKSVLEHLEKLFHASKKEGMA